MAVIERLMRKKMASYCQGLLIAAAIGLGAGVAHGKGKAKKEDSASQRGDSSEEANLARRARPLPPVPRPAQLKEDTCVGGIEGERLMAKGATNPERMLPLSLDFWYVNCLASAEDLSNEQALFYLWEFLQRRREVLWERLPDSSKSLLQHIDYFYVKPERLAYLLDAGADIRAMKGWQRPFEKALEKGCYGSTAWRAYLDKFHKPSTQLNAIVVAISHCLRMPEENFLPILDELIARGYLHDRTPGMTAIEIAAQFGYARAVRVLLANGISPDPPSDAGSIFVSLARCKTPAAIEIADMLLAKGASITRRDWRGRSLVKVARDEKNQPLADFLLAHGAPE